MIRDTFLLDDVNQKKNFLVKYDSFHLVFYFQLRMYLLLERIVVASYLLMSDKKPQK